MFIDVDGHGPLPPFRPPEQAATGGSRQLHLEETRPNIFLMMNVVN